MAKGVRIEMVPLDEDHVLAKITWSEQDVGGGKLVVEVIVKNMKTFPLKLSLLKSVFGVGIGQRMIIAESY